MDQEFSAGIEITKAPEDLPNVSTGFVQVLDENAAQIRMDDTAISVAYHLNIPDDLITFDLDKLLESDTPGVPIINEKFVKDYFQAKELYESIGEQLEDAKYRLKEFIELNHLGSISSNGMDIKYTPSTTTTVIDTVRLKREKSEIAAEYSKVSPRSSSISISKSKSK